MATMTEHLSPDGKPLLTDPFKASADPDLPAFLAPPVGVPVYHGFPIVEESRTEDWCFGAITSFEDPEGCGGGDGFVVAPDGSRAGIVWTVGELGEGAAQHRPDLAGLGDGLGAGPGGRHIHPLPCGASRLRAARVLRRRSRSTATLRQMVHAHRMAAPGAPANACKWGQQHSSVSWMTSLASSQAARVRGLIRR
jgi:hypothetical protein